MGIDHPALQLTVLRKPYEMLLRSYCPTSGARSLAREAAARRFLTVRLYAGRFSLLLYFDDTKESSLINTIQSAILYPSIHSAVR